MNASSILTPAPVAVAPSMPLAQAMSLFAEHDVRHLPVIAGGRLVGILEDRDVALATGGTKPPFDEGTVGEVVKPVAASVASGDPLTSVLGLLVEARLTCLPVVDGSAFVGLITEVDVLRAYVDACRRGDVIRADDPPVRSFMTASPVTIAGDDSADEAATLLEGRGIRHLVVVDGGEILGMLSDRDVRRARGRGRLGLELVSDLMSPAPRTARPDEGLSSVATILSAERISALPVVDRRELVGIVTTIDTMIPCALAMQAR